MDQIFLFLKALRLQYAGQLGNNEVKRLDSKISLLMYFHRSIDLIFHKLDKLDCYYTPSKSLCHPLLSGNLVFSQTLPANYLVLEHVAPKTPMWYDIYLSIGNSNSDRIAPDENGGVFMSKHKLTLSWRLLLRSMRFRACPPHPSWRYSQQQIRNLYCGHHQTRQLDLYTGAVESIADGSLGQSPANRVASCPQIHGSSTARSKRPIL